MNSKQVQTGIALLRCYHDVASVTCGKTDILIHRPV